MSLLIAGLVVLSLITLVQDRLDFVPERACVRVDGIPGTYCAALVNEVSSGALSQMSRPSIALPPGLGHEASISAVSGLTLSTEIGVGGPTIRVGHWNREEVTENFDIAVTSAVVGSDLENRPLAVYSGSLDTLRRQILGRSVVYRIGGAVAMILAGSMAVAWLLRSAPGLFRLHRVAAGCLFVALFLPVKDSVGYILLLGTTGLAFLFAVANSPRAATSQPAEVQAEEHRSTACQVYVLFALLSLAAVFFRFYNLGKLSLTIDEVYTGITARQLLSTGAFRMPDGTRYTRGAIDILVASGLLDIGVDPEFAVRAWAALSGVGITFLAGAIAGRALGRRFSMTALATFALFPWAVEFSRWGRFYSSTTFFVFLSVFAVLKLHSEKEGRIAAWGVLAVSIIGGVLSSRYGYFTVVVATLSLLLSPIAKHKTNSAIWFGAGIAVTAPAVFWAVLNPSTISALYSRVDFDHEFINMVAFGLPVLAIGLVVAADVAFAPNRRNERPTALRLIVLSSLAGLVLVSVYNIHKNPRYVYFPAMLTVLAAVVGYEKAIQQLVTTRPGLRKIAILAIPLVLVSTAANPISTLGIPFREHGDSYSRALFAPSAVSDYIADRRSNMQFAATVAEQMPDATTVVDGWQFFYFYTGTEPDYAIRIVSERLWREDRDGTLPYMARTVPIATLAQFGDILSQLDGKSMILPVNSKGGKESQSKEIGSWMVQAREYGYSVREVFQGEDTHSKVLLIDEDQ